MVFVEPGTAFPRGSAFASFSIASMTFAASFRSQDLDAPGWTQQGGVTGSFGPSSYVKRGARLGAAEFQDGEGFRNQLLGSRCFIRPDLDVA